MPSAHLSDFAILVLAAGFSLFSFCTFNLEYFTSKHSKFTAMGRVCVPPFYWSFPPEWRQLAPVPTTQSTLLLRCVSVYFSCILAYFYSVFSVQCIALRLPMLDALIKVYLSTKFMVHNIINILGSHLCQRGIRSNQIGAKTKLKKIKSDH